jgi:hypothetical protein
MKYTKQCLSDFNGYASRHRRVDRVRQRGQAPGLQRPRVRQPALHHERAYVKERRQDVDAGERFAPARRVLD